MSATATATPAVEPTTIKGKIWRILRLIWATLKALVWYIPTLIVLAFCISRGNYVGIYHATWWTNWAEMLFTTLWSIICHFWRTPGWWFIAFLINFAIIQSWKAAEPHHHAHAGGHAHPKQSWLVEHKEQELTYLKYWSPTLSAVVLVLGFTWYSDYVTPISTIIVIIWCAFFWNMIGIWCWKKAHSH